MEDRFRRRRPFGKDMEVGHDIVPGLALDLGDPQEIVLGDLEISAHLLDGLERNPEAELSLGLGERQPHPPPGGVAVAGEEQTKHLGRGVAPRKRVVEAVEVCHTASIAAALLPLSFSDRQAIREERGRKRKRYSSGLEVVEMVHVTSEIGRLRRVLVHEPGVEVDRMVPPMMEELLFDDILFGERARDEHGRFRRLLQILGIEVVEAGDLLRETLADDDAREWLWRMMLPQLPPDLRGAIPADADEMVATVIGGLLTDDRDGGIEVGDLFRLTPLPNWCFQRDPQVILGSGVVFSAMATPARWREGLLARAVFRFHPELGSTPVIHDPMRPEPGHEEFFGYHRPRLEGGDVLVLSREIVAIGVSERTNALAVDALARGLARMEGGPRWLEIVHLPRRRAYMHLDTVFTPADRDAALVFPPVIAGGGPQLAQTYEVDLRVLT